MYKKVLSPVKKQTARFIIIRAYSQSPNLIGVLTFCSQKDYRNIADFSDFHHRLNAIHFRHHDIHEHQVNVLLPDTGERLLSVKSLINPVSVAGQINFERGYNVFFVITN